MLQLVKDKYNLPIRGVIHIGAHYGQEYAQYVEWGVTRFVFFEPLPGAFAGLKALAGKPGVTIVEKAIGPTNGPMTMYVETANSGMSSSLLAPGMGMRSFYADIVFRDLDRIEVEQVRLDDWMRGNANVGDYNMINIDVQGYELQALQGAPETLAHMDAVYAEINRLEMYESGALVDKLDEYLASFGFERVETTWMHPAWGEGLYLKRGAAR